jgi:hypothetical protein
MKANELRVGNLLQGEPISLVNLGVYGDGVTMITGEGISLIEQGLLQGLGPIPLTESWLLKLGFKYQDRDINTAIPERFYISPKFSRTEFWLECNLPRKPFNRPFWWLNWDIGGGVHFIHLPQGDKLEYIHQLQNLYYALTGEELTIK